MRLIDADALKKAICIDEPIRIDETWEQLYDAVVKAIDNAPTVEVGYLTNCANCERVEKIRAKRPHGKWIITGEEQGAFGIIYKTRKCSKCGWEHSLVIPDNFCPNCGADMRGVEDPSDMV